MGPPRREVTRVGYYGRLAGVTFKKDQLGRDVFFPFGVYGKGRVLPNAAVAARVRRRIKTAIRTTLVVAAIMLISLFFFLDITPMAALVGVVLTLPLGLASRYLLTWPLVRNLPISDEKLTSQEVHERTIAAYGRETVCDVSRVREIFFLVWGVASLSECLRFRASSRFLAQCAGTKQKDHEFTLRDRSGDVRSWGGKYGLGFLGQTEISAHFA